jgi:muconate cycloisomerase
MRIVQLDIHRIRIPFKRKYIHAEAGREEADNIIVQIRSDDSATGIGETIPRTYLTGETPSSVMEALCDTFAPRILGTQFSSFESVSNFLSELVLLGFERSIEAAFCAVDLALTDLAGKSFSISVLDALGGARKNRINYSGPISGEGTWSTAKTSAKLKLARFKQVKVKVGLGDDEARLSVVRRIMGGKVDIRVDANCAWEPEEAVEKIKRLKRFNISSVEQPVGCKDLEGLRFVRERCGVPVMADESMCSVNDAVLLAEMGACDILNVRLAKCGGITGCLKVIETARQYGLKYQLGCLVGESSVLAAAGRALAFAVPDFIHLEGSYNRHLLESDIAQPRLGFGFNGSAAPLGGYGLGVQIDEGALEACTVEKKSMGMGSTL